MCRACRFSAWCRRWAGDARARSSGPLQRQPTQGLCCHHVAASVCRWDVSLALTAWRRDYGYVCRTAHGCAGRCACRGARSCTFARITSLSCAVRWVCAVTATCVHWEGGALIAAGAVLPDCDLRRCGSNVTIDSQRACACRACSVSRQLQYMLGCYESVNLMLQAVRSARCGVASPTTELGGGTGALASHPWCVSAHSRCSLDTPSRAGPAASFQPQQHRRDASATTHAVSAGTLDATYGSFAPCLRHLCQSCELLLRQEAVCWAALRVCNMAA